MIRSTLAFAALLSAAINGWAADAPEIVARHVLPAYLYGAKGLDKTDLDGDGRLEIMVTESYGSGLLSAETVQIRDPYAGYAVRDVWVSRDYVGMALARVIPSAAGAARRIVVLDKLDTLHILEGLPLKESATFTGTGYHYPGPVTGEVGDVDGDGIPDLAFCSQGYIEVARLSDGARRTIGSPCTEVALVQFDGTPQKEILAIGNPPRIYDGTTGAVLSTGPAYADADALEVPAVVNADNDPQSELVAFHRNGDGLYRVEPAQGWAQTAITTYGHTSGHLRAVDVNGDGRDEYVAQGGTLISLSSGVYGPSIQANNRSCENVLVGNFDGDASIEGFCGGVEGAFVGVFGSSALKWDEGKSTFTGPYLGPVRPVLGDVDGDGRDELVTAAYSVSSGDTSQILLLDPDTLALKSASIVAKGSLGETFKIYALGVARLGAGPAGLIVGGSRDGAQRQSWIARLDPGNADIAWSDLDPNSAPVAALAALDIDGNGDDEIAALSTDVMSEYVNRCDVRLIDGAGAPPRWNVNVATSGPDRNAAIIVQQVDGIGAPDLIVACRGRVAALRGEDGHELWNIPFLAETLQVRDGDLGPELLLASASGLDRRDIATGAELAPLPAHASAVSNTALLPSILALSDQALVRLDATTGAALSPALPIGFGAASAMDFLEARGSPSGTFEAYLNAPYGIVKVRSFRAEELFADGFE